MSQDWQEPMEDDGLTLGPEEALAREIARSKALKVERLQLRDRVQRLEERVRELEALVEQGEKRTVPPSHKANAAPVRSGISSRWAIFLLAFNLVALGLLLLLRT